jgi:hypothetical protein
VVVNGAPATPTVLEFRTAHAAERDLEGGGAEHGVGGVLVGVQAGAGEEGGGVAGDGFGDRTGSTTRRERGHPRAGRLIRGWTTSTKVTAEDGLGQSLAVQYEGAAGDG